MIQPFTNTKLTLITVALTMMTATAWSQCQLVFDFYGQATSNPTWYSCSGGNFSFNLSSPNTWNGFTINWGDGSPVTTGATWAPPAFQNHVYPAAVAVYNVTITETSTGCVINGTVVMEEATSASIQIPVGGLTQSCAPQTMAFINSSTNVSGTTVFTWDFGDGSPVQTFDHTNWLQTITHTYQQGTVDCETEVTLTAENNCNTVQGGNSEAQFNPIRIWDIDEAGITASATTLCYPDTTVTFSNTTERNCLMQGNIYQRYEYWNFGDYWGLGYDSIIDWTPWPPTFPHTLSFPGIGTYTVELADSNYCGIATTSLTIQIVPPPTASISANRDTICVGESVTFYQNASGGANVFQWNFGTNAAWYTTGGGNLTYVYNTAGTYQVGNIVSVSESSGCADTAWVTIVVLPRPSITLTADETSGCDSLWVDFSAITPNAVSWEWDMDNGSAPFMGADPAAILYDEPGNYHVSLTVENANGCSNEEEITIHVHESPEVDFSFFNVCEGQPAQFTDLSVSASNDDIEDWAWDFGDGATSDLQNPEHSYSGTGNFLVQLFITTEHCSGLDTATVQVQEAPVASFSADVVEGCGPLTVNFTNTSEPAATYQWNLGNGLTTSNFSGQRTYINLGSTDTTYMVTLSALNSFGCGSTDTLYITVFPGAMAMFDDGGALPSCEATPTQFQNNSLNAVGYAWDFGDGATSNLVNPSHTYINNTPLLDIFEVTLIAYSNSGCNDTTSTTLFVYPMLDLDMAITGGSGCAPYTMTMPFVNGIQNFQWDFGDGTTSPFATPTHTFENMTLGAVTYDVTLIGTSAFGCSDTTTTQVTVNPNTVAQFNASNLSGCAPLTVDLNNLSINATTFDWNYGDGTFSQETALTHAHVFNNNSDVPVVRTVSLATNNIYGCSSTYHLNLEIYPQIQVSFTQPADVCSPATVQFTNTSVNVSAYSWNLGNGLQSVAQNPTGVYENITANDMDFTITLTGASIFGCVDSVSQSLTVLTTPVALFEVSELAACAPVEAVISNQTVNADSLYWNFGNGVTSSSNAAQQTIVYENNGSIAVDYTITLNAWSEQGCSSQQTATVSVYPQIQAVFADPADYCSPATVQFISSSVNANSVQWNFGNGTVSSVPAPSAYFTNDTGSPVDYTISLLATSTYGCVDSVSQVLTVNPTPIINFTPSTFGACAPLNVEFTNNSQFANEIVWTYGDGSSSTTTETVHSHLFENFGTSPDIATVTLSAVSAQGCNSSSSVEITVYPAVNAAFMNPGEFCSPAQVNFINTSMNAVSYQWNFGNGLMSIMANPNTNFTNNGFNSDEISVSLIAANSFGCTDTAYQTVTIHPTPEVALTASVNGGCSPLEVTLHNDTPYADSYTWYYGTGAVSHTDDADHVYTFVNNGSDLEEYNVVLEAYSNQGCAGQANVLIQVYPHVEASFEQPSAACSPVSVGFINTSTNGSTYQWDFDNGVQSIMENPVVYFANNGDTTAIYNVSLNVTSGYGCQDSLSLPVLVYALPNANFILDEPNTCAAGAVTIINNSTGATSFMWDYGDGTASNTATFNHVHDFTNAQFQLNAYTIELIATSEFGCVDQASANYTIYPGVVAAFAVDTIGCAPHNAPFVNQSVGAVSYVWNFGDGQQSVETSPVHLFDAPFNADVELTVEMIATNMYGCTDTATRVMHIMHTPQAIAQIDTVMGCYPANVVFYNGSIGADNFNWIYGTGQTSNTADEYHEYQYVNVTDELFTFHISLQASTDFGCTSTDQLTLDVAPQIQADFNSITQGCSPLEVYFDNISDGGSSVAWDFGDGDISNAYEPQHTFFNWGANDTTYAVTLVLYDSYGCSDTITRSVYVFANPVAGFEVTPQTQIWPAATIEITNTTVGGQLAATWNMNDGNFLYDFNPGTYTYEQWGEFNIQLVVSNGSCSDTTFRTIEILPPSPVANFTGPAQGCAPLRVQFNNLSENAVVSTWSFGDGNQSTANNPVYTYYQPGIYSVTLTVVGPDGSSDVMTQEQIIYVYANATASFAVTPNNVSVPGEPVYCLNLSANASSYAWEFGDGSTSTEESPLHYYQEQGDYDVTLIATNENGCADTLTLLGLVHANDVGEIEFPNAFTPNVVESSGGYYNIHSLDNDVFFPMHKGVEEYQLQIFNKWGELIYESTDIAKGWDGYYRGQLVKQDVYVWKVDARFVNGQRYEKAGDVTVIVK